MREQPAFFRAGAHVKALGVQHVAELVGMHESTIMRVAHGKYLHCSRGLFELEHFLLHAVS